MEKISRIYKRYRKSETSILFLLVTYAFNKVIFNQRFLIHQKAIVKGKNRINSPGFIEIGVAPNGFITRYDRTLLNVRGELNISGNYSIGRGCRIDVGPNAVINVGSGGFINANSKLIIQHSLNIGDNCAISWGVQILDDDFHELISTRQIKKSNEINIGNQVWIGCNVKIYKGVTIPNGCVVASDSVVKGGEFVENSLIAGNPAKVVRENISWKL